MPKVIPVCRRMSFLPLVMGMFFALIFCLPEEARAGYLDPGSGSVLVQGLIAVLAFWGRVVQRIKAFFGFGTKP